MILESGIAFRNFAEQKSFSFDTSISASTYSGESNMGFSGNGNYYNFFKFKNGKVYDPLNRFVHTYSKDQTVELSGDFCSGKLGYYINNNLLSMDTYVCDSSKSFDYFLISTSGAALNFDLNLYGEANPNYNISFVGNNILTGRNITGNIVNTSNENWRSFKIFSGSASFNYSDYSFQSNFQNVKVSGGQSGNFLFNYFGDGSNYSISEEVGIYPLEYNLKLYTNFGFKNNTGSIGLGYIPPSSIKYSIDSSGLSNNNFYFNYLLDSKLCSGSNFAFSLEKVSGFNYINTVNKDILVSGLTTGTVSGFVSGFGNLSGVVSGNLNSNQYDFYGNRVICSRCAYNHLEPFYATGLVNYIYNVRLTGLASGYDPVIDRSGVVTAIISGTGVLSKPATFGYAEWSNLLITGTGSLGKVYVKPKERIPGELTDYTEISPAWYSNFSGFFDFKIDKTGFYSSGLTNRQISTTTNLSYIDYDANFKYNFNIKSGYYSTDGGVQYSPSNVNYDTVKNIYSGTGFLPSTTCFPIINNPSNYIKFEINHYNPYNNGRNNVMKYVLSGLNGEYLFSGLISE